MIRRSVSWPVMMIFVLLILGLACNFGGGEEPVEEPIEEPTEDPASADAEPTEAPVVEELPTDTPVPVQSNAVSSLEAKSTWVS